VTIQAGGAVAGSIELASGMHGSVLRMTSDILISAGSEGEVRGSVSFEAGSGQNDGGIISFKSGLSGLGSGDILLGSSNGMSSTGGINLSSGSSTFGRSGQVSIRTGDAAASNNLFWRPVRQRFNPDLFLYLQDRLQSIQAPSISHPGILKRRLVRSMFMVDREPLKVLP